MEKLSEALCVALHDLLVVDNLFFLGEEDTPHGAHMITGHGNAGTCRTFT